jgi:hypothetical protein
LLEKTPLNAGLRGVFAKHFLGKYPEKNQTSGELILRLITSGFVFFKNTKKNGFAKVL